MASEGERSNGPSHEPVCESANGKFSKASYSICSLFDVEKVKCLISGAVLASCTPSFEQHLYGSSDPREEKEISPPTISRDLVVPSKMACSVCATDFSTRADQIQHYKLDWHRFNAKGKLKGNSPISETAFDEISGDISSLSGSDSESESRTSSDVSSSPRHKTRPSAVPDYIRARSEQLIAKLAETSSETDDPDEGVPKISRVQPKVYFQNDSGEIVGLYRCVIHSRKNSPETKEALVTMLSNVPKESNWVVILIGGGHFAAAIFEGSSVVEHKTFHRYTVRAKQGGSQASKDSRQLGHNFSSAGSSLRRHNESALSKDIQDLLSSWSLRLQTCHRIFYRAPSFNRSKLFGGKYPPFKKDDVRLRTIPFPTRRATYSEVQRVHKLLSSLECFGDSTLYKESLPVSPKVHLGNRKKKTAQCSEEAINLSNNTRDSKGSPASRSTEKNAAEENCDEACNGDLMPSTMSTCSPVSEKIVQSCSLPSAVTVQVVLSESDEPDKKGYEEEAVHNVQDMKVPLPPKRRNERRKTNNLVKRQKDPDSCETVGEKYQTKHSLYDACKAGNLNEVQKILDCIVSSKETFVLLNLENPTSSAKQNLIATNEGTSAKDSIDVNMPCPNIKSPLPCSTATEPSKNENKDVNVPSEHVPENSGECDLSVLKHEECASTSRRRRHSSFECRSNSDFLSLISGVDKCTYMDNGTAHSRHGSVPSSPKAQQNRKQRSQSLSSKDNSLPVVLSTSILNEKLNDEGTTLLHVASKEGHCSIVKALLESGADPTIRNRKGLTPYMVSSDKEMRNVYRRFMAAHPECYDYSKAQIPSPLTEEQEAEKLEKSKEKKKLKKAKMKEKKIQAAELKKEEEEKQRFLSLSDREKRALAAERRYVQQLSAHSTSATCPVLSRCFSCGVDITGKTPFEYLDYIFCSVVCVKKHRAKSSS